MVANGAGAATAIVDHCLRSPGEVLQEGGVTVAIAATPARVKHIVHDCENRGGPKSSPGEERRN